MADTFAQAILDSSLRESDMNQIISDRPQTVTVKRITTTGNGFSAEIADYTSIGTIVARIDNPGYKAISQYRYLMSLRSDVESIEQVYVGITRDTTKEVRIGDVWVVGGQNLSVIAFTGGQFQDRIEVLLTTLDEAVNIIP